MTDPTPPAPNYQTPQPYGSAGYSGGMVPPTNTLAIIALVLAFVVAPAGIVCGHIAMGQIKRTGESGHGLALAGTVIGYVFTGIGLLVIIAYIAIIAVAIGSVGLTSGSFS